MHFGGPQQLRIQNAMSFDVEDYFQVWALASQFPRSEWDGMPMRVERNVDKILELLAGADAKATFFTLGWVVKRFPGIARAIVKAGHELASHGSEHYSATDQKPAEFTADIRDARLLLEDVGGVAVTGYRAPNFSVGDANPWAFDCIQEAGYRYSSSVYPVVHDHYGMPDAPRFAYESRPGLLEIPVTTVRVNGRNWPAGGGGYFRFLPYSASRWLIRRVNQVDGQSAVFYLHPWELDPGQPRANGGTAKARFRHYVNLARTEARLAALLRDFSWNRMDVVFAKGAR